MLKITIKSVAFRIKELPWHELIGLHCKVVWSKNKDYIGIEGTVVDETKNLLILRTERGIKKILKDRCVFGFKIGKGFVLVPGEMLVGRPEERLKKFIRYRRRYLEFLLNAVGNFK